MIDRKTLEAVRAIYRRMGDDEMRRTQRGWRIGRTFISTRQGTVPPGVERISHLKARWALEQIREYVEATKTGQPMRHVPEPVRRDGGWFK